MSCGSSELKPYFQFRLDQFLHDEIAETRRDAGDQLNFSPAALTMAMLLSISFAISASNWAGVRGIGSIACGLNFSITAGRRSTSWVSACRRSIMARGVFAGTSMPFQNV